MPKGRNLEELLVQLPERHQEALRWFLHRAGTDQPYPKPIHAGTPDETLLATKAKGIYKPKWTDYALSVKETLDGPYPDKEPVYRADGTWSYQYFQENADPTARDAEFTNKGLLACHNDLVPVGVMRQVKRKPHPQYRILGVALVAFWDTGYFHFEGFSPEGASRGNGPAGYLENVESALVDEAQSQSLFDPADTEDARKKTLATIVRRRGQPAFRRNLLEIYGSRCSVTGCDVAEALEAAHITPYLGPKTNHTSNGLLLRADIHTLFDLGKLAIDEATHRVIVATELQETSYRGLHGRQLALPDEASAGPSRAALLQHRVWANLSLKEAQDEDDGL